MPESVYICYRRDVSQYIARAVFGNLRKHEFDVFLDVEDIDPAQFEKVNLNQVGQRTHFVVMLMAGSLERCKAPDDAMRREIEKAFDTRRHVVPVLVDDFRLEDYANVLVGKLSQLRQADKIRLRTDEFVDGVTRLREKLNSGMVSVPHAQPQPQQQTADQPLKTIQLQEQEIVERKIARTSRLPEPSIADLSAEQYFGRAYEQHEAGDLQGALSNYDLAIQVNPQFAEAYNNRGIVRSQLGHGDWALADYDSAVRLNPQFAKAYYNRGNALYDEGEFEEAIRDHTQAVSLDSSFAEAFNNRGLAHYARQEYAEAISDYNRALELQPNDAAMHNNRGNARRKQGDLSGALTDYNIAIQLNPEFIEAYNNRAITHELVGDFRGAIEDYERYLSLGGGHLYGDQAEVQARLQELRRRR